MMSKSDLRGDSFWTEFFRPQLDVWRGRRRPATVFWIYGVAVSCGLIIAHASALRHQRYVEEEILIVVSAAYTAWILAAIWRTMAPEKSYWAKLARGLTVAWAINTVMVLAFIQLDLIARLAPH